VPAAGIFSPEGLNVQITQPAGVRTMSMRTRSAVLAVPAPAQRGRLCRSLAGSLIFSGRMRRAGLLDLGAWKDANMP